MNGQSCDGRLLGTRVNFSLSPLDEDQWFSCAGVPVSKVATGCVHEHVIAWDACPDCAEKVLAQVKGGSATRCPKCWPGDDGHTCPVIVQVLTRVRPSG